MNTNIFKNKFNSKISYLIIFVILIFSFSPVFAKPVHAQWVVWDPGNFVPNTHTAIFTGITAAASIDTAINTTAVIAKEFGLDAVAWTILNLIIERMSASTVQWINSGFKGSPAFITDPESYFQDLGDKVAGQFIFNNPNLNFLCGSMSAKIKIALSNTYGSNDRRWQCKLTTVAGNMDNFMNDFERGGWDKFFVMTQDSTQNPVGAYIQAEGQLFQKIANKTDQKNKELSWGKGFFSFKDCAQYDSGAAGQTETTQAGTILTGIDENGNEVYNDETTTRKLPDTPPKCIKEKINTPGSVISDQLNKTLGLGGDKLVAADELNEIVSALLNQLISHVIGGIGRGLRGLSNPDPANNNRTFTNQLDSEVATSTADYFGNTQNTTILNTPLPTPAGYQAAGNAGNSNGAIPTNPVYPPGQTPSNPFQTCNPAIDSTCSSSTP